MLALANNAAHHGKAARFIPQVMSALRERGGDPTLCAYWPPFDLTPAIQRELASSAPQIVAIGGDGTVNQVLNAVLRLTNGHAPHVLLGAVGLGSSNDVVKPPTRRLSGWSARVDPAQARAVDLVRVTARLADGSTGVRHALANVGLGAIAEANRRFNENAAVVRSIKKVSATLAIHWVALRTIAGWRGVTVRLQIDDGPARIINMDTLSALKIPWIAGGFRYEVRPERDDGRLWVCTSEGGGRLGLLRLMRDLSRGRFQGGAGRSAVLARSLHVRSETPLAIECDGEVASCREARIDVLPRAIGWMG